MKRFLFLLLSATLLSSAAYAKHDGNCKAGYMGGGFLDTSAQPMSVADVLKQPKETYVTLHGHIVKQLSKDTYSFTDGKDNLTVEIENKYWHGQTISPKDKLAIGGEVDHEDGKVMVDVKSLHVVK